jgi:hypothetical protein
MQGKTSTCSSATCNKQFLWLACPNRKCGRVKVFADAAAYVDGMYLQCKADDCGKTFNVVPCPYDTCGRLCVFHGDLESRGKYKDRVQIGGAFRDGVRLPFKCSNCARVVAVEAGRATTATQARVECVHCGKATVFEQPRVALETNALKVGSGAVLTCAFSFSVWKRFAFTLNTTASVRRFLCSQDSAQISHFDYASANTPVRQRRVWQVVCLCNVSSANMPC